MKTEKFVLILSVLILLFSYHHYREAKQAEPKNQVSISPPIQTQTQKPSANPKQKPVPSISFIPNHLQIPTIKLDAVVEPVTVLKNGQMGVPDATDHAGILVPWTKPGENGNAVISGHLDSYKGPAVFFHLKKINLGDQVIVSNSKGSKLIFTVKRIESYKKEDAPLQQIFGTSDKPQLNLITCAGKYDRKKQDRPNRLVIFTELVD